MSFRQPRRRTFAPAAKSWFSAATAYRIDRIHGCLAKESPRGRRRRDPLAEVWDARCGLLKNAPSRGHVVHCLARSAPPSQIGSYPPYLERRIRTGGR